MLFFGLCPYKEIREPFQYLLEILAVHAKVMLKQGFYVHVQRQAVPQVAKDLLVLFLHRGNISPAKGRVQIPHTVHMGSNVVHGLPDAVVAGIVVQKPVEVVIQRDEEVICCILIQIKVFVLPVQQFLKFVQLFPWSAFRPARAAAPVPECGAWQSLRSGMER